MVWLYLNYVNLILIIINFDSFTFLPIQVVKCTDRIKQDHQLNCTDIKE